MEAQGEKHLRKLHQAIKAVRMVDETIPTQTLAAFLIVAMEEGQTVGAISEKLGLAETSGSRNIKALSDWDWKKRTGLKLIEYGHDPMHESRKPVFLSKKGKALAEQLANIIAK